MMQSVHYSMVRVINCKTTSCFPDLALHLFMKVADVCHHQGSEQVVQFCLYRAVAP